MTDSSEAEGEGMFPKSVGERLAATRLAAKVDLEDVSARTRIPLRHLEAIEGGRYADLPSVTYASGFAKAYARVLGLDEAEIGRDVRAELQAQGRVHSQHEYFEPADPARVPPRFLVWTTLFLILLVGGGYAIWRAGLLDGLGGRDPAAIAAGTDRLDEAAVSLPPVTGQPGANVSVAVGPAEGQVVLTARDDVWVRISDATNQRLFENTMKPGERFEVPADAKDPRIDIGRPASLAVTVNGHEVAPLGPADRAAKNVPISAAALAARVPAPGTADPAAPAAPAAQNSMGNTAIGVIGNSN